MMSAGRQTACSFSYMNDLPDGAGGQKKPTALLAKPLQATATPTISPPKPYPLRAATERT